MAVQHIGYDKTTPSPGGNRLSQIAFHLESFLEMVFDELSTMEKMIDGANNDPNNFEYNRTYYKYNDVNHAQASFFELAALVGKFPADGSAQSNVLAACKQFIDKHR